MGWDNTIPLHVVIPPVTFSEVAATSASVLIAAKAKLKSVMIKLSAAVPATKILTVTVKLNGTTVATRVMVPADSTTATEIGVGVAVDKGDVVTVSMIGDHASVVGSALLTAAIDAP